MQLQIGRKVRVIPTERGRKTPEGQNLRKEKYGKIYKITDKVITIKTNNYNISFNINEIISPHEYYLLIWNGKEWDRLKVSENVSTFKEVRLLN